MLHLLPLPGAPRFGGDRGAVRERLLADADALAQGGVDGLLIENFGDAPFLPGALPPHVVADMTALACAVRARFGLPLGVNCLRNDALAALAVAQAAGGAFVRVNVLCGARVTDQGVIEGLADRLLRERARLGAAAIRVVADVDVKHSAPLGAPRAIEDEVADLVERGGADALVVSGSATGRPADPGRFDRVRAAAEQVPVLVGSGVDADSVAAWHGRADGVIVGTSLKRDGDPRGPVDPARVRELVARVR
ncbi:MAG: BtpA/SgcQ family protein [Gammaproteobacteria bacterium]|nr:BtpA/SgcQ family protein [Gammaproteobacteria bacterium]